MPRFIRCAAAIATLLIATGTLAAQNVAPDDPPKMRIAANAPTQEALDRRASLYQFVKGLECEHEERLLEALTAYKEAERLDDRSAAVFRVQVPILIALERGADALAACKKVVERDVNDARTWAQLARLCKAVAHHADARQALEKGLRADGIDDRPELAQQMYFDLGALYEADEKHGAAADAYMKAAQLLDHPDVIAEHAGVGKDVVLQRAAETYERIGDLYRKARNYPKAAAAYAQAQKRYPERAERLNFNLAQVHHEQGDDARALTYLDAYLRTQPLGMDAYDMKIAVLRGTAQAEAIVPWLEDVSRRDKYNVALHLLLARECGRAKQTARAEQIYRTLAETNPCAELYRGLFGLYHVDALAGTGRSLTVMDQAMARASRKSVPDSIGVAQAKAIVAALREDPELARVLTAAAVSAVNKATPLRFATLHFLAAFADKHGQSAEAEKLYRSCFKEMPLDAEPLVYGGLIRVLSKARRFEALLEVCDAALDGNSAGGLPKAQATNQVMFLTEKARALAGLQRFTDAIHAADRALLVATETHKLLVRHLRVRLLVMASRYDEGEQECMELLKEYSQPAEVLETRYLLSNVYSAAKQMSKAEAELQKVLKADPDNATANNDLGYVWADQNKNLEEAERMIRKAIAIDRRQRQGVSAPAAPGEPAPPPPIAPVVATTPAEVEDNASYVDSLGWVLFRRGEVERARRELEHAAQLPDGQDPVIWDHLGDVYQRLARPADARRAWEHALKLYQQGQRSTNDGHYPELQRKLKTAAAER